MLPDTAGLYDVSALSGIGWTRMNFDEFWMCFSVPDGSRRYFRYVENG